MSGRAAMRCVISYDELYMVSVVFGLYLEIALRMIAHRALIGSLGTYDDVTAVCTLPYPVTVS